MLRRPGQLKHYPPNRRLVFLVIPAMPRLSLQSDTIPSQMYSGEVRGSLGVGSRGAQQGNYW